MAKTVAVVLGVLFLILGFVGFAANNLLGAHLSWVHNLIHIVSGAASLYIGLRGSVSAAKLFGYLFGLFYLGLGVAGYWLGMHQTTDLPTSVEGGHNEHMFRIIPGFLELGTMDHLLHFLIGSAYIIAALATRRSMAKYLEHDPMSRP